MVRCAHGTVCAWRRARLLVLVQRLALQRKQRQSRLLQLALQLLGRLQTPGAAPQDLMRTAVGISGQASSAAHGACLPTAVRTLQYAVLQWASKPLRVGYAEGAVARPLDRWWGVRACVRACVEAPLAPDDAHARSVMLPLATAAASSAAATARSSSAAVRAVTAPAGPATRR